MLACHKCDHQIIDPDAHYCPQCGKALPAPEKKRKPGPRISPLLLVPAAIISLCPLLNLLMLSNGQQGGYTAFLNSLFNLDHGASILEIYAKISTSVLLVLSFLVAVLFVFRKSKAPLACLGLFTLYAIDNLVVALWMHQVPIARFEIVSMMTAKFLFWGLAAYVWWGYISVSERVRATFVY